MEFLYGHTWTAMGMAYNKECSSVSGQRREIENRDALFRKIGGKSYPETTEGV